MNKYLAGQAELLLKAVTKPLIKEGFSCKPQHYENMEQEYPALAVTDTRGEEDVVIDVHSMQINGRECLLLQYKCLLISEIEEALLAELKIWLEQANILMPLGSLVLLGQNLLLRYSLLCPATQLPEQAVLDAATDLFFLQRIVYADIGVDLLVGEINLEEALSRLRQQVNF